MASKELDKESSNDDKRNVQTIRKRSGCSTKLEVRKAEVTLIKTKWSELAELIVL
jgi:hypothetical protein